MPPAHDFDPDAFRDVCFVIMPFGKKRVGTGDGAREVDFDRVFQEIFEPAIQAVELPESEGGGRLRAVRTDRDFHAGHISQDMFEYIEYSRFALADITGLNANVFYELGARHRAHESGTAIFRQGDAPIPFDISQIKAFPYTFEPTEHVAESRTLVTRVLTDSLERNAWDSPIMLALRGQRKQASTAAPEALNVEEVLIHAENAVRAGDGAEAHRCWLRAAELDPTNPLHDIKASYWPKEKGEWDTAIGLLHSALAKAAAIASADGESTYSDAYRELGIAQNKKERDIIPRAGEESLRRAVHYAPTDFDAWSSLGGILKRAGDLAGALECYDRAVEISNGHPYPLLNAIKLRAHESGVLDLDGSTLRMLAKAEGFREAQVENDPPIDVPWAFFDLAEILLYLGETERALEVAVQGLDLSTHDWMPGTFLGSLRLLPDDGSVEGLSELKALAETRERELRASAEDQG